MKKIAIIGATGYIGRSLYPEMLKKGEYEVFLFSRDLDKLAATVQSAKIVDNQPTLGKIGDFGQDFFDVVINATGISDTYIQRDNPGLIFSLTEDVDNLILNYLSLNPESIYINCSSGAVFGTDFSEAITDTTVSIININKLKDAEYYSIAKLNAEAKHRAFKHLSIVDVRIYSFFSSFVDTSTEFLMSDVIRCIKYKDILKTNDVNIVRDYITPVDLWALIEHLIAIEEPVNDAFDLYSQKTVSKFDLLEHLHEKFGLKFKIIDNEGTKPGFSKNIYYTKNRKAESIGYVPKFSSIEGIINEINKMYECNLL